MPEFDNISFDLPKNQSNVIKVIGVGGGGSNAINHMFNQGIKGVDFVICNTDAQALENSAVPNKIQLGIDLTEGLGAGANPKIGEQSAVESMADIKSMLTTNTKMIFITAGMGGGTGTGAAPIIARMAKDLDILTVGIVTIPFHFEGAMRNEQAQIGVENLRQNVDSLVVINNNKLRDVYGNLGFKAGFSKADEVLATAARGIAEVITHHYTQNIDLRDAKTVLSNSGTAIMGSATSSGVNRAQIAITKALDSPLLNDNKIAGAKNVLLLIVSGTEEITIDEIGEISDHIQTQAGHGANIIMGVGDDETLDGSVSITVIATGFDAEQQNEITNTETKKIIHTLGDETKAQLDLTPNVTATQVELPKQTKSVVRPSETLEEPIIVHTLFEVDEQEPEMTTESALSKESGVEESQDLNLEIPQIQEEPFQGYIATSDLIKNIDVESNLVDIHFLAEFEQLVINEISVNNFEVINPEVVSPKAIKEENLTEVTSLESDQAQEFEINDIEVEADVILEKEAVQEPMLMFDMPLHDTQKEQETVVHSLEEPVIEQEVEETAIEIELQPELVATNVEDIEVTDHLEVVPISEVSKGGVVTRYSLDDYTAKEEELTGATAAQAPLVTELTEVLEEEELVFETKIVEPAPQEKELENAPLNPMNTPISKLLSDRTEERKRKMKDFNYKFRNSNSKIDDIEKQPAYKRAGIELDDVSNKVHLSRTSVSDDDDEIELRSNNSFLHDNVD
ncbi:MAG TPA: cell division protein FtsZ [Flavobacteriaceae bacterium]|nr:cell division protein FtsZ [Flavobacteriaceae bacterium]|tara:strand:+ start:10531 stop:12747 length:2217 start_codon:yes stop_codon:yes gene_type:complete